MQALTKKEISARYSTSPRTIDVWRQQHGMPYIKINNSVRFVPEDTDAWFMGFRKGDVGIGHMSVTEK